MKTKIAAIGEEDIILPFKAIGAEIYPVVSPEEAKNVLEKLFSEDIGLILIPDDLIPNIRDSLSQVKGKPLPCILSIPGSKGSSGLAMSEMRELIKKAVGVDIIKED